MKGLFNICLLVLASLGLAMCATQQRPVSSVGASVAEMGYTAEMKPTYYYIEGLKYSLVKGDIVKAAEYFDKAIELDPNYAPAYYAAATNIVMLDASTALEYSIKAGELDSTNIWYKGQLGSLRIFNGDYSNALETYKELVRISPHDPNNYRMLAALYEYTNTPFAAIAVLDSAEYKLGKIEEITGFKRELLIKVKLYDKAIAETEELTELYPYNYENYLMLAELYMLTGKDSLAYYNLHIAQQLNPNGIDVLATLNDYYQSVGDNANYLSSAKQLFMSDELSAETKIRFFNEITSNREYYAEHFFPISDLASTLLIKYPDNYEVVDLYATHMIASGSIEEALRIYKAYVTDTKPNADAFNSIIEIEAYLGRTDSVNKFSAMAIEHFPEDLNLYMHYGYTQLYLNEYKKALDTFNKALKFSDSDSTSSAIIGIIGDTYHEMGDMKKTYSNYDKALRLDPDNVMVLNNYSYFLSEENRELEKALNMSSRVMEIIPGNPTYLDTYGWILFKLGRYDEARKIIQQAVSLDRNGSDVILLHYGDVLYEVGEIFMATVYWRKAQEAGHDSEEIEKRLQKAENNK